MNFIQSIFWDSKSNGYSASRVVMILSAIITAVIAYLVCRIIYDAYFVKGIDPPDLSWLLYGGGGSALTGIGAYGFNRMGTKDEPLAGEPDFSKQVSEDENE